MSEYISVDKESLSYLENQYNFNSKNWYFSPKFDNILIIINNIKVLGRGNILNN
jgi:hypothetical protein